MEREGATAAQQPVEFDARSMRALKECAEIALLFEEREELDRSIIEERDYPKRLMIETRDWLNLCIFLRLERLPQELDALEAAPNVAAGHVGSS